jgi:putative RNA 2'-phosphotransferase
MDSHLVKLSKFLSLILRHKPQVIGLSLDRQGWANIEELIDLVNQHGIPLSRDLLEIVVVTNDQQRFAFNGDRSKIRANQGHSLAINLGLSSCQPPSELFHGTATRSLASIRSQGLVSGQRQHVHLTADQSTAIKIGQRHGQPTVLKVAAEAMYLAGFEFFVSENGVWLTDTVPPRYIQFPNTTNQLSSMDSP